MNRRPLVGITGNLFRRDDRALAPDRPLYPKSELHYGEEGMVRALLEAGAAPVLVPADAAAAEVVAPLLDGLVLSGGTDVDPSWYDGGDARWPGQPERDAAEMTLYRSLRDRRRPVLGLCRGCQLIAVAEGGTLWPDLPSMYPGGPVHRCQERYDALRHPVTIEAGSRAARWLGVDGEQEVNSVHHQAVRDCPPTLRVVARSPEGIVEAVESLNGAVVVGVQWHPEWMRDDPAQRRLLAGFVAACRNGA